MSIGTYYRIHTNSLTLIKNGPGKLNAHVDVDFELIDDLPAAPISLVVALVNHSTGAVITTLYRANYINPLPANPSASANVTKLDIDVPDGYYKLRAWMEFGSETFIDTSTDGNIVQASKSGAAPFSKQITLRIPLNRELTWLEADNNWQTLSDRSAENKNSISAVLERMTAAEVQHHQLRSDFEDFKNLNFVMNGTSDEVTFNGNVHFTKNILLDGKMYETEIEQIRHEKDLIITRAGAIAGLPVGGFTGILAKLYDGTNDGLLAFGSDGIARVGDVGSTQAIATREDNPLADGYAQWDDTAKIWKSRKIDYSDIQNTFWKKADVGISYDNKVNVGDIVSLNNGDQPIDIFVSGGDPEGKRLLRFNGGENYSEIKLLGTQAQGLLIDLDVNGVSNFDAFKIRTNRAQTRFFIANNGYTGIGTESPSATLDVNGTAVVGGELTVNGLAGYLTDQSANYTDRSFIDKSFFDTNTHWERSTLQSIRYNNVVEVGFIENAGFLNLFDGDVTTAKIRSYATKGVQAYFTAGNVGVGTGLPDKTFTVDGSAGYLTDQSANYTDRSFIDKAYYQQNFPDLSIFLPYKNSTQDADMGLFKFSASELKAKGATAQGKTRMTPSALIIGQGATSAGIKRLEFWSGGNTSPDSAIEASAGTAQPNAGTLNFLADDFVFNGDLEADTGVFNGDLVSNYLEVHGNTVVTGNTTLLGGVTLFGVKNQTAVPNNPNVYMDANGKLHPSNAAAGLWLADAKGINSKGKRVAINGTVTPGTDALTVYGNTTIKAPNLLVMASTIPVAGFSAKTTMPNYEMGFDIAANGGERAIEFIAKDPGEFRFQTKNSDGVDFRIKDGGIINIRNLPTSTDGLKNGDIYRSGNDLRVFIQ